MNCFPFGSLIQQIQNRSPKAEASFFATYRFLNVISILNLASSVPLYIEHNFYRGKATLYENWIAQDHSKICFSSLPCFVFYSAFSTSFGFHYALNLLVFILAAQLISMIKWNYQQYDDIEYDLLRDENKYGFASKVLAPWNFLGCITPQDMNNQTLNNFRSIRNELEREKIQDNINTRSKC